MFKSNYDKFDATFCKQGKKLLNNTNLQKYISTFGAIQPITVVSDDGLKDLYVSSTYFANISTRRTIVKLLQSINYTRPDKVWTEQVVIAFIDEVINLYTYEGNDKIIAKKETEISKRYNVAKNRLKSQVSLFLMQSDKGSDKYHISSYFTRLEILLWKYRDIEKLQQDVEDNKISKSDLFILNEWRGE